MAERNLNPCDRCMNAPATKGYLCFSCHMADKAANEEAEMFYAEKMEDERRDGKESAR